MGAEEFEAGNLIPMPSETKHAHLANDVPYDDISILGATGEFGAVPIPGQSRDGGFMAVEGDDHLLSGGGP